MKKMQDVDVIRALNNGCSYDEMSEILGITKVNVRALVTRYFRQIASDDRDLGVLQDLACGKSRVAICEYRGIKDQYITQLITTTAEGRS